jgi:hypothetical protein
MIGYGISSATAIARVPRAKLGLADPPPSPAGIEHAAVFYECKV